MNIDPFYSNPADSAMGYMNQIPSTITPYYQPYVDAGQQSLNTLMGQYNTLLSNPSSVMNSVGSGFQQSPGHQYQLNQGMNAANSAASAGGMLGTPYHQQQAASTAEGLANQDYYNYVDHGLGLYNQGLSGMSGINQMGYGASNELASSLAASLMNQGNMAYAGQANQNAANGNFLNTAIGLGTALF